MGTETVQELEKLARLVRYYILVSTTRAGSGHPTSSLSATELMVSLLFGGTFRYDIEDPANPNNDRLIFSKGHATPLFYAQWTATGKVSEENIMTYRQFGSPLEGHPSVDFPFVEAPTGSLGQGLSIGTGQAINAKHLDKLPYRTYVLLGDSEMAEGSQWEAIQIAAHYKLENLTGILDVNRLGQRGETMYGHDLRAYEKRIASFGWETILVDGHSIPEILDAYEKAMSISGRPQMIIAKTIKGKGVGLLEDQNGWHGKTLDEETFKSALEELGPVDKSMTGIIPKPEVLQPQKVGVKKPEKMAYAPDKAVATRKAYGNALKRIYVQFPNLVVLDGEVSNSTGAARFKEVCPERFFEMYVAEQNMTGVALGLACRGKMPFVSTFSAFFTRAFDQIRMSQYAHKNMKFVGSHAGVSIGEDGPSQMGLEDLAMFRTLLGCVVLYPSDAISTEKLVAEAAGHDGMVYIRTTRGATPIIYDSAEAFPIGGSKVLKQSAKDLVTVVGAGITLHEALAAYDRLREEGIYIRVIDLYSVKPLDENTLFTAAKQTSAILTVEDHYAEGGVGEAVRTALAGKATPVHSLAVRNKPRSGPPEALLDQAEISSKAVVEKVKTLS